MDKKTDTSSGSNLSVMTQEGKVGEGNTGGWDKRFEPGFRNSYDMIKVVEEVLKEFIIVGREGLGVNVTGN